MSRRRTRGFTLIEVVIALAILGLSLAALYGAFASALARARRDAQLTEATLLAQSLLARTGTQFLNTGGSSAGEWNEFHYQLMQEAAGPPSRQPTFTIPTERVKVRVWWAGTQGSRQVELSTLKLLRKVPQ
jgi:general secretion pathway protein I